MRYPLHHWPPTCFCYFYAQWLLSTLWVHSIQFPQFTIFPITRLGTVLLRPFSLQTKSLTNFSKPASPASWTILPHSLALLPRLDGSLYKTPCAWSHPHSSSVTLCHATSLNAGDNNPSSSYLALTSKTKSHLFIRVSMTGIHCG